MCDTLCDLYYTLLTYQLTQIPIFFSGSKIHFKGDSSFSKTALSHDFHLKKNQNKNEEKKLGDGGATIIELKEI